MNKILNFEKLVESHSLFKGNILYNTNALSGESGEVSNQVKKLEMLKAKPEWTSIKPEEIRASINDELGDVLFYLTRVALDNGSSLEEIMHLQAEKLDGQNGKYGRIFLK